MTVAQQSKHRFYIGEVTALVWDSSFDLYVRSSFEIRARGEAKVVRAEAKTPLPLGFCSWALDCFILGCLNHVLTTPVLGHFGWGHFSHLLITSVLVCFWWGNLSHVLTIPPLRHLEWGHPAEHISGFRCSRMTSMQFKSDTSAYLLLIYTCSLVISKMIWEEQLSWELATYNFD